MSIVIAVLEYLLGFVSLVVFAVIAFYDGSPTPATFRSAFMVGGVLAIVELALLMLRPHPVNRLIIGVNIWLIVGALAFIGNQRWMLDIYNRWQAAGIVACIIATGIVSTVLSRSGFVAEDGPTWAVRAASLVLLAASGVVFWIALTAGGPVQTRIVIPMMALALLARLLRVWVNRQVKS